MKLIVNYKDWITAELMEYLSVNDGFTVPVWQPDRWQGHPMLDQARERARLGYSNNEHFFQQFNIKSPGLENFVTPEIPSDPRWTDWWFVKLLPGQMQSMHFDPHLINVVKPRRYTMFLQDYQPGHVFVWENKMFTDYSAGDIYEWEDPMCYHGVVNISYTPRYTLQLTTHDQGA